MTKKKTGGKRFFPKKEFKDLISDKKYVKYHNCLVKYKQHLRKKFESKNKEKKQIRDELKKITNIENDYFTYIGGKKKQRGGLMMKGKADKKIWERQGNHLKRCIKNFAKDLDKEEKVLKERLKRVQLTKRGLVSNVNQVLDLA